jgi:Methyltransferase domain
LRRVRKKHPKHVPVGGFDYATAALRRLKPSLPSTMVFDIGPGACGMKDRVESEGLRWRGFDLVASHDVEEWNVSEPGSVEGTAGTVLLIEVLEHLVNPGIALKNIAAVMEPGAYLIMTTPNPHWSGSRVNMFFRGVASGFSPQDLEENHHVFTPWPHVIARFLSYAGLTLEEYVTISGKTRLFGSAGNLPKPVRYGLNTILIVMEWLDSSAVGMSQGMIARKLPAAN